LDNQIKKKVTSRRGQKQDQAIEDAEQLPKEKSIVTLIKRKVVEKMSKMKVNHRISNKAIHNLSSYNLSFREKILLGLIVQSTIQVSK
jgi:hypothetical protein